MQTPVEIDFQGMRGRPEVQATIEHHVAELEQRYGRVTACRVVLKGPGGNCVRSRGPMPAGANPRTRPPKRR